MAASDIDQLWPGQFVDNGEGGVVAVQLVHGDTAFMVIHGPIRVHPVQVASGFLGNMVLHTAGVAVAGVCCTWGSFFCNVNFLHCSESAPHFSLGGDVD